jgi:hypothetical protein
MTRWLKMSAYKNALHVNADDHGQRMRLAEELLNRGETVVLDEELALRPVSDGLLCEVIASSGTDRKDLERVNRAIKRGKALLRSSQLGELVAGRKLTWLVVDDYGMGTRVLWQAPEDVT